MGRGSDGLSSVGFVLRCWRCFDGAALRRGGERPPAPEHGKRRKPGEVGFSSHTTGCRGRSSSAAPKPRGFWGALQPRGRARRCQHSREQRQWIPPGLCSRWCPVSCNSGVGENPTCSAPPKSLEASGSLARIQATQRWDGMPGRWDLSPGHNLHRRRYPDGRHRGRQRSTEASGILGCIVCGQQTPLSEDRQPSRPGTPELRCSARVPVSRFERSVAAARKADVRHGREPGSPDKRQKPGGCQSQSPMPDEGRKSGIAGVALGLQHSAEILRGTECDFGGAPPSPG